MGGNAQRIGEIRNEYKILLGEPKGNARRQREKNVRIKKYDRRMWAGFNWLKMGTRGGLLEARHRIVGFYKNTGRTVVNRALSREDKLAKPVNRLNRRSQSLLGLSCSDRGKALKLLFSNAYLFLIHIHNIKLSLIRNNWGGGIPVFRPD
jgi:hypothetical protein